MEKSKARKVKREVALALWLGADPFREAVLIKEVPVKASTLGRIRSGSYKPSARLWNAIMAVIERK